MMDWVQETLSFWERVPFNWSDGNCDMSLGDYVLGLTGKDPCAKWRQGCQSQQDAEAYISEAGGNIHLIEEGLRSIGVEPEKNIDPQYGDVVAVEFGKFQIPGIFLSGMVAFRSETGVFRTKRGKILKVWRCA